MNPFSRFLSQWSHNADFDGFVQRWDELEALIIRVYKAGAADMETEAAYTDLRGWLRGHYPQFQAALEPHWRAALVAGEPAGEDPFLRLLRPETAAGFVNDWVAMQHLPAAREALNRALLAE